MKFKHFSLSDCYLTKFKTSFSFSFPLCQPFHVWFSLHSLTPLTSRFILSLPSFSSLPSIHLQDRGFTQYEWDTGLEWVTMIQWAEWTNNKQSTESHHTAQGHITNVNCMVTNRDMGQYFVPLIIFPYAPGLYINTL